MIDGTEKMLPKIYSLLLCLCLPTLNLEMFPKAVSCKRGQMSDVWELSHHTVLVHLTVKCLTAMPNGLFGLKPMIMKEHLIKFYFIICSRYLDFLYTVNFSGAVGLIAIYVASTVCSLMLDT